MTIDYSVFMTFILKQGLTSSSINMETGAVSPFLPDWELEDVYPLDGLPDPTAAVLLVHRVSRRRVGIRISVPANAVPLRHSEYLSIYIEEYLYTTITPQLEIHPNDDSADERLWFDYVL